MPLPQGYANQWPISYNTNQDIDANRKMIQDIARGATGYTNDAQYSNIMGVGKSLLQDENFRNNQDMMNMFMGCLCEPLPVEPAYSECFTEGATPIADSTRNCSSRITTIPAF